eukprot:569645-Prorocentrum_minimum.AAC.3
MIDSAPSSQWPAGSLLPQSLSPTGAQTVRGRSAPSEAPARRSRSAPKPTDAVVVVNVHTGHRPRQARELLLLEVRASGGRASVGAGVHLLLKLRAVCEFEELHLRAVLLRHELRKALRQPRHRQQLQQGRAV